MNLGFNFGFEEQAFSVIPKLLIENWHFRHEDVASSLQDYHEQAGPEAIENLYTAAITKFDYLAFDEACALAVKCTWALGAIGYGEAVSKLKLLSKIENEVIAKAASYQLDRLEKS